MPARTSGSAAVATRPIAAGRSRIPGTSPRRGNRIRSARCAFDHCVLDSHFAADALGALVPSGASLDQLGAWLGAAARRQERRVIYTPFLSAIPGVDRSSHIPAVARRAFVTAHGDLMPDALLWSPHAGLTYGQPFRSMGPGMGAGCARGCRKRRFPTNRSSKPIGWRATFPSPRLPATWRSP